MEILYFTAAGIFIYVVSDALLDRIEEARGGRLPYRSVIFFGIMLVVALITFAAVRALLQEP